MSVNNLHQVPARADTNSPLARSAVDLVARYAIRVLRGAECMIGHFLSAEIRCGAVRSQSISTFRPRIQRLFRSYR
jgi:hypothetical protein